MPEQNPLTSTQPQQPMLSRHSQILSCKTEPEQSQLIAQVFARLASIYMHKWTSVFTTKEMAQLAQAEWLRVLRPFTVSQINRAIDGLIKSGNAFPPSLPEFYEACAEIREDDAMLAREAERERVRRAYVPPVISPEEQARNEAKVRESIAQLRKLIGVDA